MRNQLTVTEVATLYKQKTDTVRANVRRGTIKAEKIGGIWLVDGKSAKDFYQNRAYRREQNVKED